MIDFLNEYLSVVGKYVAFLFSLQFLPGVSIGSFLLVASILYAIVILLWPRR